MVEYSYIWEYNVEWENSNWNGALKSGVLGAFGVICLTYSFYHMVYSWLEPVRRTSIRYNILVKALGEFENGSK